MERKIYNSTGERIVDFVIGGFLSAPFILVAIFALYKSTETNFLTYLPLQRFLIIFCIMAGTLLCAVLSGIFLWKRAKFMSIGLFFFVLPALIFGLMAALTLGACGLMLGK